LLHQSAADATACGLIGPHPLRSSSAEETEAQADTRMWLEDLEEEVTEELAKQREYEEYKRQLREQQPGRSGGMRCGRALGCRGALRATRR
jgi:hypothetical protein